MSKLLSIVDVHNSDFLVILSSFSALSLLSFTCLWFYNRKKFQSLEHNLPADVVKNYIDAIIHNSNTLKNSLFRGDLGEGILPVGGERIVEKIKEVPVADSEAQAALDRAQADLKSSEAKVKELEKILNGGDSKLKNSELKVAELEAKVKELAASGGGGGGDSSEELNGIKSQLDEVTKEKETLRERLQEYEIIEDDLANLKRLQQENEQLKKSLAAQGGATESSVEEAAPAVAAAPEPSPEPAEEAIPDNVTELTSAIADDEPAAEEAQMAEAAEEAPAEETAERAPSNDPDDLLREFEKMLG